MLELWGMRSTPSPDKDPTYGLDRTKPCFLDFTGFLSFKLHTNAKLNCLE